MPGAPTTADYVRRWLLVAITLCYCTGVLVDRYFALSVPLVAAGLGLAVLATVVLRSRGSELWLPGLLVAVGLAGGLLTEVRNRKADTDLSWYASATAVTLKGYVLQRDWTEAGQQAALVAGEEMVLSKREAPVRVTGRVMVFSSGRPLRLGGAYSLRGRLSRPTGASNWGQFSYADYLSRRGVYAVMRPSRVSETKLSGLAVGRAAAGLAGRTQEAIAARLRRVVPEDNRTLVAGMLGSLIFGNRACPLPAVLEEQFRRSNTVHILVVSGTQVSMLAMLLVLLGRRSRMPRLLQGGLLLACLLFYALIVGGQPSVARSVLMTLATVGAVWARRDLDLYSAMAFALLVLTLYEPMALFDIGLQLSFLATFGVVHVAPVVTRWMRGVPRYVGLTAGASLGSQIVVAPVLAYYFHQLSAVGVLANLVVVPLAGVLLVGGVVMTALAFMAPALGAVIGWPLAWLVRCLVWVVGQVSGWRYAAAHNFPWSVEATLAVYGGMVAVAVTSARWQKAREWRWRRALVCGVLVVAVAAAWRVASRRPDIEMTALDVGAGYAAVVRDRGGRTYLLDAGGYSSGTSDAGERVILPFLLREWVRGVQRVVVTSSDFEHTSCLATVLQEMPVKEIVTRADLEAGSPAAQRAAHVATRQGIPVQRVGAQGAIGLAANVGEQAAAVVSAGDTALVWCPHATASASLLERIGQARRVVVFAPLTLVDPGAIAELEGQGRLTALVLLGRGRTMSEGLTAVAQRLGGKLLRTDTDGAVQVRVRGNRVAVRAFQW